MTDTTNGDELPSTRIGRTGVMSAPVTLITEEAVERAATVLRDDWLNWHPDDSEQVYVSDFEVVARRALEAAFGENHQPTEGQENR